MNLSEFLLARIAEDEAPTFELIPYRCEPGCCAPAGWVGHRCLICGTEEFGGTVEAITAIALQHDELIHQRTRRLAKCNADRRIVEAESRLPRIGEWTPDCGGDWCLNVGALSHEPGLGAFANYWPDNTVSASVYVDGDEVADSGIVAHDSKAECQAFAEQWVREQLPNASPVLRLLALPYADHPDYDARWTL